LIHNLQRHDAVKLELSRLVNVAESTRADQGEDFIFVVDRLAY
jgi:hypothetical protein